MTIRRRTAIATLWSLALVTACADRQSRLTPGEGSLPVPGGQIWYRVTGTGSATPVVLLHGGPGAPSYYLNPLVALRDERPVIIYDQLGAGRSDRITDTTRMTIASYVAELDSLRRALGLERFHVLGHSWGTILGVEYALAHPEQVTSLILASPALSIPRWLADADSLLGTLPDTLQRAIARHEAAGTFDSPEYQGAVVAFYRLYLSRLDPWSPDIDSTFAEFGPAVYEYMWGPSEFTGVGTLKDYDVTSSLGRLRAPTLLTTGEYDEALPATVRYYASLIPGAEVAIIPGAAHLTMQDNPAENLRVVRAFLRSVDQRR
ncbi:MAG: proline iminopeptidase-family hydrolase [Gemmatimonadota bacterium]|nr:proline iminopeptidase-family hydrolase [Gemmatimonadota bacterium]